AGVECRFGLRGASLALIRLTPIHHTRRAREKPRQLGRGSSKAGATRDASGDRCGCRFGDRVDERDAEYGTTAKWPRVSEWHAVGVGCSLSEDHQITGERFGRLEEFDVSKPNSVDVL